MTESEKIAIVQKFLTPDLSDITDDEITAYLSLAGDAIIQKAFPFDNSVTAVPGRYENLQCEITVYLIGKRGAEGELIHDENGIKRSYEAAEIPSSMLKRVIGKVGVPHASAGEE